MLYWCYTLVITAFKQLLFFVETHKPSVNSVDELHLQQSNDPLLVLWSAALRPRQFCVALGWVIEHAPSKPQEDITWTWQLEDIFHSSMFSKALASDLSKSLHNHKFLSVIFSEVAINHLRCIVFSKQTLSNAALLMVYTYFLLLSFIKWQYILLPLFRIRSDLSHFFMD